MLTGFVYMRNLWTTLVISVAVYFIYHSTLLLLKSACYDIYLYVFSSSESDELSEYEKKQLERIATNQCVRNSSCRLFCTV